MKDKECCATCDWFALEPGKRRTGACLHRWIPDMKAVYLYLDGRKTVGAYGRMFSWETCDNWTAQGTIERLEPEVYE